MGAAEFDLISRIRARIPARDDVVLGIGDDACNRARSRHGLPPL